MATGLALPLGVSKKGSGRLVTSDENDEKIISLALGDDANENAFQQNIGMGSAMFFQPGDDTSHAPVIRRLREIFKRFKAQKRFILRENTIRWSVDPETQDKILEFQYFSIESDEEKNFRRKFVASRGG